MSERDWTFREEYDEEEADSFEMARERISAFWLAWKNNPLWQRIVFIYIPLVFFLSSIVFTAVFNLPAWDLVRLGFNGGLAVTELILFFTVNIVVKKVKSLAVIPPLLFAYLPSKGFNVLQIEFLDHGANGAAYACIALLFFLILVGVALFVHNVPATAANMLGARYIGVLPTFAKPVGGGVERFLRSAVFQVPEYSMPIDVLLAPFFSENKNEKRMEENGDRRSRKKTEGRGRKRGNSGRKASNPKGNSAKKSK